MKLGLTYLHTILGAIFFRKHISTYVFSTPTPSHTDFRGYLHVTRDRNKKKRESTKHVLQELNKRPSHLILSCTGGASPLTTFLKRLASVISDKHVSAYSTTANWMSHHLHPSPRIVCVSQMLQKPEA